MHLDELSRASRTLEEINPRRRGFLGIFGGIDWALVVRIVLEILRRLGYLSSEGVRAGEPLPASAERAIDREFPLR